MDYKRTQEKLKIMKEKLEDRNYLQAGQPKDAKKPIMTYGFDGEPIPVTPFNPKHLPLSFQDTHFKMLDK